MEKRQVVLFCNYSSDFTRSHLVLSNLKFDNIIRRLLGQPRLRYVNSAPWIEAFVKFFQQADEYELHVVSLQVGMKKDFDGFEKDGVHYRYIKSGLGLLTKLLDSLFNYHKKRGFPIYKKRFKEALKGINPDVLLLCGAENPDYVIPFLHTSCPNRLVIMQTLMNDSKRIQMGVSSIFRREVENQVFMKCKYYAVPDLNWIQYVKTINNSAICFPFTFPTIKPVVEDNNEKQYDFVFFAGVLGRFKGTNDLVEAMTRVVINHPFVSLNIIGGANKEYMDDLHKQVSEGRLVKNIVFTPSFKKREDVFKEVVKAKYAVLPGITASLNSTVRETMFLGMPTIVYETADTKLINKENLCLLTAKMEDVEDLTSKIEYALSNRETMEEIGRCGQAYAASHFSQEAFNVSIANIIQQVLV